MTKGRRPVARDLKLVTGTLKPGRDKGACVSSSGRPKRPDWLSDEVRREWNRVVPELQKAGVLSVLDRGMLAVYCSLWAQYAGGERRGVPIKAALISQMRAIAASFGLTPSDRARLNLQPQKSAGADGWDRFS